MPCVLRGRVGLFPSQGPQAASRLVPGPRLLYTDASQPPEASAELLRAPRKCSARMFNHRRFHFLIFVVEPCSLLLPVVTAAPELGAGHLEVAAVGTLSRREGSPLIPPLPHTVLGAKSSPRWVGLVWAEPGRMCGAQGSRVFGPRRAPLLSGQGAMGLLAWCPWWDTMVSRASPWALGVPTCRGIFLVELQLLSTGTPASGLPAAGICAPMPQPLVSQVAAVSPLQGTWPVAAKVSPLFPSRRAPSRSCYPSASTEPCRPLRRLLGALLN